jgi:hypothetical protein
MKKMFFTAMIMLLCTVAGAQKRYQKMGLKFKVPSGWKVGNEQPEKNAIYYSAEKQGELESGLVSFIIIGYEFDLNSFLLLCTQNIENSANMNEGKNFAWGKDTSEVKLGDFTAKKLDYSVLRSSDFFG